MNYKNVSINNEEQFCSITGWESDRGEELVVYSLQVLASNINICWTSWQVFFGFYEPISPHFSFFVEKFSATFVVGNTQRVWDKLFLTLPLELKIILHNIHCWILHKLCADSFLSNARTVPQDCCLCLWCPIRNQRFAERLTGDSGGGRLHNYTIIDCKTNWVLPTTLHYTATQLVFFSFIHLCSIYGFFNWAGSTFLKFFQ